MKQFSDYNFGDYSGFREYTRNPEFFVQSFIEPEGFSFATLRNSSNFIIVGRKGTGKSSCCLRLAHEKKSEGYVSTFFNFSEDLSRHDIKEAVITQSLNLSEISTKKLFDSVVSFYDFRDIWIRKVLHTLSSRLADEGSQSTFVKFSQSARLSDQSIAEGVGRGLNITPDAGMIASASRLLKGMAPEGSMPLRQYNAVCQKLLVENHRDLKHFFFFDELNLSHANTESDQYSTLLALVRDVVRSCAQLNDFFVSNGMDVSVICCLRPEVRTKLLEIDPELSKIVDSNSVDLSWSTQVRKDNPLLSILRRKILSAGASAEDIEKIVPDLVKDMDSAGQISFEMFFLNLTWYRPRDVIRILKSYQNSNGSKQILFAPGYDQVRFLKEYSRVSKLDCFAELEVKYTPALLKQISVNIRNKSYTNIDYFKRDMSILDNRLDIDELIQDFFDAGVIANHQNENGNIQIIASYRGDLSLNPRIRFLVHRGLRMALQLSS